MDSMRVLLLLAIIAAGSSYEEIPGDYQDYSSSNRGEEENGYKTGGGDFYAHAQDRLDSPSLPDTRPDSSNTRPDTLPDSSTSSPVNAPRSCKYHHYSNSFPSGKTKVDYLHFMGHVDSYRACAELCCQHGERCQQGWLFKTKCFAVSCSESNKDLCQPKSIPNNAHYTSSLVVMKDRVINNNKETTPTNATIANPTSTSKRLLPSSTVAIATSRFVSVTVQASQTVTSAVTVETSHLVVKETSRPIVTKTSRPVVKETPQAKPHIYHLVHKTLSVAVDNTNPVITLPTNHIKIFSSTWPQPTSDNPYHYRWKKVFGPNEGSLVGVHQKTISLSHLIVGKYGLEVLVYDENGNYGLTFVNITVRNRPHANQSPNVIVSPSNRISMTSADKLILDASKTTDDNTEKGSLLYQWDLISGPLQGITGDRDSWNKPVLELQHLKIGNYIFKLSVTDADSAVGVAYANVTVQKEPDYPPTANAGESILIHLPRDQVTLDASKSKDDKGIAKYSWKQIKGNQVEMKGIKNKTLAINKLEVGVYQFELTVTDTAGQTASTTVTVDVQEENNQPPVAITTGNVSVYYPKTSAILNASSSTDDYKIIGYHWTQLSGPTDVQLNGLHKPVLHVGQLHVQDVSPTQYLFQLTVIDYRNLTNSTTVCIAYHKDEQILPVANAGPDVTVTLPQRSVLLNGSLSYDGFGIKRYQWVRSDSSPALGSEVGGSNSGPILLLSDLVNGTYNYTLVVTNNNGKENRDSVIVHVKEDPLEWYLVQVYLDTSIYTFTKKDLEKVTEQLVVKIGQLHYQVIIQSLRPHDQHILVEFYVKDKHHRLINATAIYDKLIENRQDFDLANFQVIRVEESVCQNPCSSHGNCDQKTKKCVCSTFWMENPFKAHYGSRRSNCEWSVLYVILVVVGVVIIFSLCVWLCCCCYMHRRRSSRRRRVKYAILDHNKEEGGRTRMLPQGYNKNSLIVSETDTEEEILFESSKKTGKPEKQALIHSANNAIKNNLTDPRSKKNLTK